MNKLVNLISKWMRHSREDRLITRTLLDISNKISSSLNLQEVLNTILEELEKVISYDYSVLLLLSGEYLEQAARRYKGRVDLTKQVLPIDEYPLNRLVLETKQPVLVRDAWKDERWVPRGRAGKTRSWIGVPLMFRDQAIGILGIGAFEPALYQEEDVQVVFAFANHAAIAIEKARLYEQAELERRKLSAILEGTTDAVITLDDEGKVILLNQAARRAFGLSPGQILDRPLSQTIPNEPLIALFVEAARQWKVATTEIETPEGRTLHAAVSPVKDVGWVIIMRDITHLKELDRLKSELIAMVSHDLKNPITTIKGFVELLNVAGKLNENQQEFVKRIEQATDSMINLIDDLLDIAKIEAGLELHMEPCQMSNLISEVIDNMNSQAVAKSLRIYSQLSPSLPLVKGDKERLKQVLANLLSNAIKYTPPGGKITVRASFQNGQMVVEVEDTGIGIAPQDQEQLFQKFYRVRTPETAGIEGTGLGLAIVKSIVEQHGGQVFVKSEPGIGSTFGFSLPSSVALDEREAWLCGSISNSPRARHSKGGDENFNI